MEEKIKNFEDENYEFKNKNQSLLLEKDQNVIAQEMEMDPITEEITTGHSEIAACKNEMKDLMIDVVKAHSSARKYNENIKCCQTRLVDC